MLICYWRTRKAKHLSIWSEILNNGFHRRSLQNSPKKYWEVTHSINEGVQNILYFRLIKSSRLSSVLLCLTSVSAHVNVSFLFILPNTLFMLYNPSHFTVWGLFIWQLFFYPNLFSFNACLLSNICIDSLLTEGWILLYDKSTK